MKNYFIGLLLLCASSLYADPVLVGHPGLASQPLDDDDVRAVLLGKKVALGNVRIVIVIARTGDAQNAFLQAHVSMTTSQFQNHWRRLFMTGNGSAPKIVSTEAEACTFVAQTAGAVAITDSAAAGGLTVIGE